MGLINKIYSSFYNIHFPFRAFTLSILIITILPSLIQDGMFIDGIQYAAVSKNLANGLGTFWFPYLSENWIYAGSKSFLEHPPLVYAVQSIFFRILGDGIYTERIYCFLTAVISAFLIIQIWNLATYKDPEIKKISWLPVLIWIGMPLVYRSFQMNVQENTMGVFILAAVYWILKGLGYQRISYFCFTLAGVFIFLSSLCKGLPGLFPLVAIGVYWLAAGRIKFSRVILYSLILFIVPALLYIFILFDDTAYASLSFYISERLIERVQNEPVVNSHFHIILRLILDLIPAIVFFVIMYLTQRKRTSLSDIEDYKRNGFFFLLLGIAGSFPLALTLVQRDFYLAPSLPYYAIGVALLSAPFVNTLLLKSSRNSIGFRLFRTLSVALIIGGLAYTGIMAGKAERDQDILHDTYIMGGKIEEGSRVRLAISSGDHWRLELYLIRHFNICLGGPSEDSEYLIRRKSEEQIYEESYKLMPMDTQTYSLYKKSL